VQRDQWKMMQEFQLIEIVRMVSFSSRFSRVRVDLAMSFYLVEECDNV